MNTKTVKIVMTILMVIFTLSTISQVALATTYTDIPIEEPGADTVNGVKTVAGKILGLIRVASGVATVVLIAVFGFKFIMGSANEKADYQKSFIPLIVGVAVVFAATYIADLLFGTFTTE